MRDRKTVRPCHEPGHLHELTFSCFQAWPLLNNDAWTKQLAVVASTRREYRTTDAACNARYVFIRQSRTLLYSSIPIDAVPRISLYLARIKQPFSKIIKGLLEEQNSALLQQLTVTERPGKHCFRFWQEGPGFDRNLSSPKAISASLNYIHNNPVNRGLCERAVDWRWSSARFYLAHAPVDARIGPPEVHSLLARWLYSLIRHEVAWQTASGPAVRFPASAAG